MHTSTQTHAHTITPHHTQTYNQKRARTHTNTHTHLLERGHAVEAALLLYGGALGSIHHAAAETRAHERRSDDRRNGGAKGQGAKALLNAAKAVDDRISRYRFLPVGGKEWCVCRLCPSARMLLRAVVPCEQQTVYNGALWTSSRPGLRPRQ